MRALGIDLGSKRIGVALSDSAGTVAVPYEVVTRTKDRQRDHRRLVELAEEAEVECVVVGMPYSLDGSEGPAARRARAEIEVLRRVLPVPVETYDERLSTVTADRSLRELQLGAGARRRMVGLPRRLQGSRGRLGDPEVRQLQQGHQEVRRSGLVAIAT